MFETWIPPNEECKGACVDLRRFVIPRVMDELCAEMYSTAHVEFDQLNHALLEAFTNPPLCGPDFDGSKGKALA